MSLVFTIILAVLLDHWLGEPQKFHPLVFFGQLVDKVEKVGLKKNNSALKQKIRGGISVFILIVPFSIVIYWQELWIQSQYWGVIDSLISSVILYFCIAAKSLKQHALRVFKALKKDDLTLAKKQVGMIVSRQTEKMSVVDIRKATIESVLENGADAVFAPLFWFIIAGPTGAVIYRLSNTLDAMWGYKNQRYINFGWAAARFDDLLNWCPARLTAISYALLGNTQQAIQSWKTQASLLDSPNAGSVMTAGAGALQLKLGGAAWYHGVLKEKIDFGGNNLPENNDILRANTLMTRSLLLWVLVLICFELLGAWFA
jgi:adenosylcobinamide-phosphate synthase